MRASIARPACRRARWISAPCIHCSACVQTCPMDIRSVGDKECIGCGVCMAACPTKAIGIRRPFGK
ncbi:4Fe-4S binding protein [uncultured Megasphaera sp.]|uniref:4Fe-4S binding protein n=1 Tax=uncultured Megasphaera sp. TaxID=165188 RepID=UPI00345BE39D